jgi:GT2 family glycosyltransferase
LAGIECSIFVAVDQDRHGYTRTVNEALSNVGGDAAILVDDCEVRTGWLATLQKEVYKRDSLKVWFAGPSGPCRTWPQNSGRPGDNRRPKLVSHVAGFCIYARHEAVLLGLDEQYVHYASDVDWQRRAQRDHGARALWVPSVYVGHALHEPHMEWWQHDHELLRQEWG